MGRYGRGFRDCCDSPDQNGQPHVHGCKFWPQKGEKDRRREDARRHDRETFNAGDLDAGIPNHFDHSKRGFQP